MNLCKAWRVGLSVQQALNTRELFFNWGELGPPWPSRGCQGGLEAFPWLMVLKWASQL